MFSSSNRVKGWKGLVLKRRSYIEGDQEQVQEVKDCQVEPRKPRPGSPKRRRNLFYQSELRKAEGNLS